MAKKKDVKYDKAMTAIKELFNDMAVPKDRTRANLSSLRDEIEIMIESLDESDDEEKD